MTTTIVKGWAPECLPDPDNTDGMSLEGKTFEVFITNDELLRILASYDPESGTSPGVADCRPIVRAILNAAKETGA
jgi:hypothetical protein